MDTDHRTENRVADVVFPYPDTALTIKSWAEGDRPREKLMQKGSRQLSDAELLAILLGSGTEAKQLSGWRSAS